MSQTKKQLLTQFRNELRAAKQNGYVETINAVIERWMEKDTDLFDSDDLEEVIVEVLGEDYEF